MFGKVSFSSKQAFLSLCLLLVVGTTSYFFTRFSSEADGFTELKEITQVSQSWTFLEASQFFKKLADLKGAPYSYEVLKRATLPPGIDFHLLGHIVGDELYKQQGIEGISFCTADFRNACSHAVVIGALFSQGEKVLPLIAEVCKRAPGGSGAYTMCFHGLGHGVLAFFGYEFFQAVNVCKTLGTPAYQNREAIECVGGVVMEMIAGVHDRSLWQKKAAFFFRKDDPLYPCSASHLSSEVKPICFTYLTPHLFEAAGGSLANPSPDDFKKAFLFCERISKEEKENREECFGGFGKEFVVLAHQRDIRSIEQVSDLELKQVFEWCLLSSAEDGIMACHRSALSSLYWGGENNNRIPLRFCLFMTEEKYSSACLDHLIVAVSFYESDSISIKKFCGLLPSSHQEKCKEQNS